MGAKEQVPNREIQSLDLYGKRPRGFRNAQCGQPAASDRVKSPDRILSPGVTRPGRKRRIQGVLSVSELARRVPWYM